jgi:hypothetical protein
MRILFFIKIIIGILSCKEQDKEKYEFIEKIVIVK